MNRIWSLLFLLVPVVGLAAFVFAASDWPPLKGAWLPVNLSESGKSIDWLFSLVHVICAVFFVGIGGAIAWMLWKYSSVKTDSAEHVHGSLKLELLWSVVPGLILVFLAFYQLRTWSEQKVERPVVVVKGEAVYKTPNVNVVAKQFGWEFHYAGRDGKHGTADDFSIENVMVVPDDETIVMQLESRDVIHSFFVPKLRLKHDVVPGMTQFAWFKPTSTAQMNILCAELCGWGHYKMNALLKVVTRDEYQDWVELQQRANDPPELAPYNALRP